MRTEVCDALLENAKRGRTSAIKKAIKTRQIEIKDAREAEAEAKELFCLARKGLEIWFPDQAASEVSEKGHSSKFVSFTTVIELIPPTKEDIAARKLEEQKRAVERVQSGFVTPEMYRYAQKCAPKEIILFSR